MTLGHGDDDLLVQLAPAWSVDPDPGSVSAARCRALVALGRGQRRRRAWPVVAALAAGFTAGVAMVALVLPGALPGDLVYPVKRLAEDARVGIAMSPHGEAAAWMWVAETRIEEAVRAEAAGREELLPGLLADYAGAVRSARERAGAATSEKAHRRLDRELRGHERVLSGLLATAPEAAIPGLEQALREAHSGHGEHDPGPPACIPPPCRGGPGPP